MDVPNTNTLGNVDISHNLYIIYIWSRQPNAAQANYKLQIMFFNNRKKLRAANH